MRPGGRRLLRPALAVLGHAGLKHPGTHLYNTNLHVMDGGGTPGALRGEVTCDGRETHNLPEGSYSLGSDHGRLPEFTYGVLKKLGWTRIHRRERPYQRIGTALMSGDDSPAASSAPSWRITHPLRQRQGAPMRGSA
jgi:hypothetical protein